MACCLGDVWEAGRRWRGGRSDLSAESERGGGRGGTWRKEVAGRWPADEASRDRGWESEETFGKSHAETFSKDRRASVMFGKTVGCAEGGVEVLFQDLAHKKTQGHEVLTSLECAEARFSIDGRHSSRQACPHLPCLFVRSCEFNLYYRFPQFLGSLYSDHQGSRSLVIIADSPATNRDWRH
jgi:hypothetical protein